VLLLHALPEVVELGQRVGSESLVAVHAPRIERYPYLAPGGHYSSFGNRWLAEHYFALLAGASGGPTELVFTDVERGNGGTRASMSSFEHVEVRLGGSAAGFLAIASADPAARGGAPADLHGSAVASLLALKGTGRSIVDAAFIPLPVPLRGGEAVVLRADGVELELGRVEMLDSPAPVGVAEIEGVELHGDVVLHLGGAAWAPAVSAAGGRTTIAVGSTEVLVAARGDGPLRFTAVREPVRGLRVGASEHVDVASLGASGTATLALREPSGRVAEVALAHWSKRSAERLTSTRFPLLTEQLSRRTSRAQ
jgi:hypothetical protein